MMHGLVREGGPTYWDQAATLFDWGASRSHRTRASAGSEPTTRYPMET